jgi:hypothetical protein
MITPYNGNIYRSRHEARFAVFLDSVGITFEYEVMSFKQGIGANRKPYTYTPDFYLGKQRLYIELKPLFPETREILKCEELAYSGRAVVLMFAGSFEDDDASRGCASWKRRIFTTPLQSSARGSGPRYPAAAALRGMMWHGAYAPPGAVVQRRVAGDAMFVDKGEVGVVLEPVCGVLHSTQNTSSRKLVMAYARAHASFRNPQ